MNTAITSVNADCDATVPRRLLKIAIWCGDQWNGIESLTGPDDGYMDNRTWRGFKGTGADVDIGASEISISCVIAEREALRALNVLHTDLFTFLD